MKTIFDKTEDMLTTKEAAKLSGVTESAIQTRSNRGSLKAIGKIRMGRGPMRKLYKRSDVEKIIPVATRFKLVRGADVVAEKRQKERMTVADARIRSELMNNLSRLPEVMKMARAHSVQITESSINVEWDDENPTE
jgi:hypothetical protein